MSMRYLIKELYYQRRRTIGAVAGLSIGVALLIVLNALSAAYHEAARSPLKEIGADITVQRPGNVPEELAGIVFPCSAETIRDDQVKKVQGLPGVRGIGKAVLFWVFDPSRAWVVLGIEGANTIGPATLRSALTEGRFLKEGASEVLIERSYSHQFNIKPGDTVSIANKRFSVVGIVDASQAAKIAVANAYLPLKEAQEMAASSRLVQSVSPFTTNDVNLLFLKADQDKIPALASALPGIIDKKATIGTPDSFLKLLGSLFALSDKFAMAASLIALIVAILVAFKTMAGNVAERAREIGVLKAVGWSNRNVIAQILGESVIQSVAAGVFGLVIALIAAWALSYLTVNIPIPWDMSPRPHFLPGGGDQIFKTLHLPVSVPWTLGGFAILVSVVIGGLTGALLAGSVSRIKPSEVLRHE
jgi:ABC-type antimicrobial peptide transport system permease subunit